VSGKRFDLKVADEDDFASADWLDRGQLANSMLALVTNSQDPLVVALDDEWGTGKSHFLRLWEKKLRKEGVPVVFFNAFENDFSDDAFVALSACLAGALEEFYADRPVQTSDYFEKAAKFGKIVGKSALNIAIKATTAGVVSAVDAGEAVDAAISQAGAEATNQYQRLIKERAGYQKAKKEFGIALSDLRTSLQVDSDLPLVFIVDELDRCRPNFALDVLECLKHFFENEKTHFVLGVSLPALEESVISLYGSQSNGSGYLSRFIDYRISFTPSQHSTRLIDLKKYAEKLWRSDAVFNKHQQSSEAFAEIIATIVSKNGGSLRDVNRVFSMLYVSFATLTERSFISPPIVGGLVLMKFYEPRLFEKAMDETILFSDVVAFFGFNDAMNEYGAGQRALQWTHEWWAVVMKQEVDESVEQQILLAISRYSLSRRDLVSFCAKNVVNRFWQGN